MYPVSSYNSIKISFIRDTNVFEKRFVLSARTPKPCAFDTCHIFHSLLVLKLCHPTVHQIYR